MIVSNSTPLIAFSKIGHLPLLRRVVGGRLVIPEAVAYEVADFAFGRPGSIDLRLEQWIEVHRVASDAQVKLLLPTLDRGEAEVLSLALEQKAELVVLDELIGRRVAESLGLEITGSVGVLIRAKQLGEIVAVRPYLEAMIREGLYYGSRFVEAVLSSVGE